MIEHSVRPDVSRTVAHNSRMTGELLASDGKGMMSFDDAYRQSNSASKDPGDVITVQQLLDAAGVDLNGMRVS